MSVRRRQISSLLATALVLLLAGHASAQTVGSISGADPTAEIGSGGAWRPAATGAAVQVGDVLRTGRPGRLSVVFQDDSVVTIGEGSELVIDEQVFAPEQGTVRTALQLLQGKIRSLVSEYYQGRRGGFEVKTPTALAGVRGTDFVVTYNPTAEVTEVVGVSGRVAVNSIMDPERHGVVVTARELTVVARGELPQTPRKLTDKLFREYIEGLQFLFVSTAGLPLEQSIVGTGAVPPQDTLASAGPPPVTASTEPLFDRVPGESPFVTPNTSSVLGQPAPVISAGSGLGIDF